MTPFSRAATPSKKAVKEFVIKQVFIADEFVAPTVFTELANRAVKCSNCRGRISDLFLRQCIHVVRR